ncbi:Sodium:dicarboxylate symporter family protein [Natribacillus halophilus]|uniref:L-cystine uptake protein TcyP n=1 Tax=Natribacillus halophilus TaxID=549003 RepID=A0A1G8QDI8_9BACI|nr:Sodium:dicarboxylate symporter family protein [Natribacillus halophilus]
MDLFLTIAIIVSVAIVAALLYVMQRKHISFSIRVMSALVTGIALGMILQYFFDPESSIIETTMDWVGIAGNGYVSFLHMIAQTVGQNPLDPGFIATVLIVVAISSFSVAGVGGGATFAAIIVLPIALAGLLISIEPLIDIGRTAVNISGSMIAGIFTSRVRKDIDHDVYSDPDQRLESQEMTS